jgi:hypothetical protein
MIAASSARGYTLLEAGGDLSIAASVELLMLPQ